MTIIYTVKCALNSGIEKIICTELNLFEVPSKYGK